MASNWVTRRTLLRSAAAIAALGATPALAQNAANWPDHPLRMIIPYPAGGSTDVLFRIMAEALKDKLGQTLVVENKPGASGNIGIDVVAKRGGSSARMEFLPSTPRCGTWRISRASTPTRAHTTYTRSSSVRPSLG